jgi:hypothetical protein
VGGYRLPVEAKQQVSVQVEDAPHVAPQLPARLGESTKEVVVQLNIEY